MLSWDTRSPAMKLKICADHFLLTASRSLPETRVSFQTSRGFRVLWRRFQISHKKKGLDFPWQVCSVKILGTYIPTAIKMSLRINKQNASFRVNKWWDFHTCSQLMIFDSGIYSSCLPLLLDLQNNWASLMRTGFVKADAPRLWSCNSYPKTKKSLFRV